MTSFMTARRCFLILVGVLAGPLGAVRARPATTRPARRPNIVLLLADDLGWTDVHTGSTNRGHGSGYYQTPAIDRLADQGMSFSSMYMCPNCAPARAALMTGQSAVRNGVYNVGSLDRGTGLLQPPVQRRHILPEAVTFAETLKSAGYATCHVGKFHVSTHDEVTRFDGFDVNYGGGRGGDGSPHGYFAVPSRGGWSFQALGAEMNPFAAPYTREYVEKNLEPDANGNDPLSLVGTAKHLTDADADAAIDFMSRHLASPSGRETPFFINVAFNAVHVAIKPRPDLLAKYERLTSSDRRHRRADYAALIEGEDQAIGRILRFLDDHGLADNTLVIFTSDNGGFADATSNAPLRGSKGMFYEGGLRVPLIARLPGVIRAGAASDVMINVTDLYPTFADFAGASLPDPASYPLDGESFAPILRGRASSLARSAIYYHFPGYLDTRAYPCSVIIKQRGDSARYKLIYSYEDQHFELYNLSDDLGETHDLLKGHVLPAAVNVASDLRDDLCHWLAEVHPLFARSKASGQPTPPPIPVEQALRNGNRCTREATAPKGASE